MVIHRLLKRKKCFQGSRRFYNFGENHSNMEKGNVKRKTSITMHIYLLASFSFVCLYSSLTDAASVIDIHRSACRRDTLMKATDRNKKLIPTSSGIISQLHEKTLSRCTSKCVKHDRCVSTNYKKNFASEQEKNCELLDVNKKSSSVTLSNENGWLHYEPVTQTGPRCRLVTCNAGFQCNETCQISVGYECVDINECLSNPCQNGGTCYNQLNQYTCTCVPGYAQPNCQTKYKSCKEVAAGDTNPLDGVYQLQDGKHFCKLTSLGVCGNGGWTLALKMDGSKTTFTANSAYWTNDVAYNVENGLTSFESFEAKFPAFSKIKFDAVCVGMTFAGATNWLRINIKRDSLLDIFKPGIYISTSLGRTAWKSIISQSSLQNHCNREGFNVKRADGVMKARLGLIANEQNDCTTPDSAIGFGMDANWKCCGNSARYVTDNGDKQNAAIGYILIQ